MFKLKKYLLIFNIILFIGLGLFLITNNVHQVMAAPKKDHGKDIIPSKEESKKDVRNYYELYNTLENYSEEDRNKIIQMLSNPEITKILEDKAKEIKNQEKASSSTKPNKKKK
ncbi:SVM family protein [Candidatus Phytoplasma phoenicium]|uniref:Putative secreted effector protein containing SVM protein signal sequence (SAP11-like) n=1 Tax=Candidatus Phytoplasma phoenicium TaxID=198422 RepID=A0A0L0MK48_9MOLU|nr:SVM family protein [Candidatus Phytoplasma phoenicium]KND62670.1 putative secreted effector protein containing SVM protein signal sequence (SAP11-like) [Candidatus Phytoplasma phoenicium]UQZ09701.1 AYWB SAP11-like protein [Almond witches'-broom phytoplasma]